MIDSTLHNSKILIVDDKQTNIDMLVVLLDAKGYKNHRSTTDPRKVVELYKEFNPDLILLDLQMPYLSGFQVMEQLKPLIPQSTYLPILVLTADLRTESKQKALAGGANDFISKPFDLIEVELRIKNLLKTRYLHQQIENHNKILDGLVKERTKELERTNIELISAKEKADEMNELKSYFLANIDHEMRTPLISILGFSEILINESDKQENKETAKYIYDSAKRLKDTINSILSLKGLEKKKIKVSVQKIELQELIKNISGKFQEKANKKNLQINLNFEKEQIWLQSDPEPLEKVFGNILDNSLKYTKEGEISINVSLKEENEKSFAIVKIEDTGIGITEDKIEHIFSDFRQEKEGLGRPYEGIGLGLTIAKKLLDLLHGEISIESGIGKGTMVKIKLEALDIEKELLSKIDLRKTSIEILPADPKSEKPMVLMVEDNPGNRLLFTKYLQNDFIVEEAEDGISGIAKAESNQYDLILMDINLGPGIDGIETFKRIRKLTNYKKTPIIALTAFTMSGGKQNFLELGFTYYIQKPVITNELIAIIKRLILKSQNKL